MKFTGSAYQFLASNINLKSTLPRKGYMFTELPDLQFDIEYLLIKKPFEINFTYEVSRPCAGALEYINPKMSEFLTKKWPYCIVGDYSIIMDKKYDNFNFYKRCLHLMRNRLWSIKDEIIKMKIDMSKHLIKKQGYRREYMINQMIDMDRNRIPSDSLWMREANIDDFIGPGLTSIHHICQVSRDPEFKNFFENFEFIWGEYFKKPEHRTIVTDEENKKNYRTMMFHFNSFDELENAKKDLKAGNIKNCIRNLAASLEPLLKFCCFLWDVKYPTEKGVQFDEKIEAILRSAGKPSYREYDDENMQMLLFLYRARSSMHEGNCYYNDQYGNRIEIRTSIQGKAFLDST